MTDAQLEMFARRLEKNLRRLAAWRARNDIGCFRAFDRDIPELPVAVDCYDGRVVVYGYEGRHGLDQPLIDALAGQAARVLRVPPERVYVKTRARGRGGEVYAADGAEIEPDRFLVKEAGLSFWVSLDLHLDTGLFLDHRITRAMVRAEASGKRVLNLFGYTGAFSVYAAAGGAVGTTTVDLSPRYAQWTRDNLRANGVEGERHDVVVDDVFRFLGLRGADQGAARARSAQPFDLAVLDPPTVSKSKRASADLDVQRDHASLIDATLALLRPGGVLYFSTNFQGFSLARTSAVVVDDITEQTLPPDFSRRPPIHRAWRMVRAG